MNPRRYIYTLHDLVLCVRDAGVICRRGEDAGSLFGQDLAARRFGRFGCIRNDGDFDARFAVGVDGAMGAKHEATDVGEDGGAAGGDAVGRQELVETAEGEVDALSGLEVAPLGDNQVGEVGGVGSPLDVEMASAEAGFGVGGELRAASARGSAMRTASGDQDR